MTSLFYNNYIQRLLDETDLDTLVKVGDYLGTNRQRINDFKYGGLRATAEECEKIAQKLGVSFEEVYFTQCIDKAKTDTDTKLFQKYVAKHKIN